MDIDCRILQEANRKNKHKDKRSYDAAFSAEFGFYNTKAEAERKIPDFRSAVDFENYRKGQGGGGSRSQGVQTPSKRSRRGLIASPDTPMEEILPEIKGVLSGLLSRVEIEHTCQRKFFEQQKWAWEEYHNSRGRSGVGKSARA